MAPRQILDFHLFMASSSFLTISIVPLLQMGWCTFSLVGFQNPASRLKITKGWPPDKVKKDTF